MTCCLRIPGLIDHRNLSRCGVGVRIRNRIQVADTPLPPSAWGWRAIHGRTIGVENAQLILVQLTLENPVPMIWYL